MATVKKSVLVPYSAPAMFALVEDVEAYPQFMPWCGGARLLERGDTTALVRLDIDYRGIRQHFTTRNHYEPGTLIRIALADGPFRRLDGTWRFTGLAADASKVELEMHYEFAGALLERLVGPVFNHIAGTFIDAFATRADSLHGAPPTQPR